MTEVKNDYGKKIPVCKKWLSCQLWLQLRMTGDCLQIAVALQYKMKGCSSLITFYITLLIAYSL
jgi:hypothetical protein